MAMELNDRIAGAMAERGVPGLMRSVRTSHVLSSPLFLSDSKILNRILARLDAKPGDSHPADPRCLLTRVRAVPVSSDQFKVDLIYERVPTVTYRESTGVIPIKTQCLPGTRRQAWMTYALESLPDTPLKRPATFTYRCPARKLIVGKAFFGQPVDMMVPDNMKNAVGAVNDRAWKGMERGYWLCDGVDAHAIEPTDDFTQALCYYVSATFFTQVMHDWSFWSFLQLPNGQFAKVEDEDIDEATARGYNTDVYHPYPTVWPNRTAVLYKSHPDYYSPPNKGFTVVYPYPALNFYEIFGIQ